MYRITDEKGSGKTKKLMLLAKENNGIIVCENPYAMTNKAGAYGITGINFVSYYDFMNANNPIEGKYYIDELESFIKKVQHSCSSTGTFDGYTISLE